MKALSRRTWTCVLECDKKLPEAEQTVHTVKHPSKELAARIGDQLGPDFFSPYARFFGALGLELLRECYLGFGQMRDEETGEIVACPEKVGDMLGLLPGGARAEVAMKIWDKQFIGIADRKN